MDSPWSTRSPVDDYGYEIFPLEAWRAMRRGDETSEQPPDSEQQKE
jgi:hypothetical protein